MRWNNRVNLKGNSRLHIMALHLIYPMPSHPVWTPILKSQMIPIHCPCPNTPLCNGNSSFTGQKQRSEGVFCLLITDHLVNNPALLLPVTTCYSCVVQNQKQLYEAGMCFSNTLQPHSCCIYVPSNKGFGCWHQVSMGGPSAAHWNLKADVNPTAWQMELHHRTHFPELENWKEMKIKGKRRKNSRIKAVIKMLSVILCWVWKSQAQKFKSLLHCLYAGGWNWMSIKVPSNPNQPLILWWNQKQNSSAG